jgi:ABC-type branched-subunit amino acid transport system substrate-binding protein
VHQPVPGKADLEFRRAKPARRVRVRNHVQPEIFLDDFHWIVHVASLAWPVSCYSGGKPFQTSPGRFDHGRLRSFLIFALALSAPVLAQEPIKIGLVTALSGQSARAGEAITRGLTGRIDELNAKGGVLKGRKFELVRRDDESTPAKGVTAARELLFKEKVAVLFGGLDTPVSLAIVPIVNQEKIPFMGPWAAGTPITKNGANPNYVFRVSASTRSSTARCCSTRRRRSTRRTAA